MNSMKKNVLTGLLAVGFALLPMFGYAADENDIIRLEKQLIQKETELLTPELDLDKYLVDRAKLDGMGGWFQGKKKKALDEKIAQCQTQIDQIYGSMRALQAEIQEMVFQVASTYEQKGNFKKAIEYYLKVNNQTDAVKFRIATCYKALQDYQSAITWLLKMNRSDENLLQVVDCYKLDGRIKDAIYWLFEILEPLNGNAAETKAFDLIEEFNYPAKKQDYPNFNQRLSDIYIKKAVANYKSNFAQARQDYQKAISLISENQDPKDVSFGLVVRYQNEYQGALDMLAQQREAAERNYESMLRDARGNLEQAEHRLRREVRKAEDQYKYSLDQAHREMERAEWELARLQKEASPSAELIQQAQRNVQRTREQYRYVCDHREQIIEDHVRPYRREVHDARNEYQRIMDNRHNIIEDYIRPYKRKVDEAKRALELIRTLHEAAFG